MTAPITDNSYSQQVTQAFNVFKAMPADRLAQIGQMIQQNPQSPEAMGFAMANQYQQQLKQGAQAMQGQKPPVLQQQVAQVGQEAAQQAQQAAMMQGIAAAGPNAYALQAQDPMRGQGIAAAPENPERAATGGLVALAQGGEVRRFFDGQEASLEGPIAGAPTQSQGIMSSIANALSGPGMQKFSHWATTPGVLPSVKPTPRPSEFEMPERGTMPFKDEEEESEEQANEPKLSEKPIAAPAPKPKAAKIQSEIERHHNTVANAATPATPHETAGKEAAKAPLSLEQQIQAYSNALHMDTPAADALREEISKRTEGAESKNTMMALLQGIGSMMSAQTPYFGQALGQGLMSGANAYQQGQAGIERQREMLDALRVQPELTEMGNKRLALQQIGDVEKQRAANLAKQVEHKQQLEGDILKGKLEHGYRGVENVQKSELENEALRSRYAADVSLAQIKQQLGDAGTLALEQFRRSNPQLKPEDMLAAVHKEMEASGVDAPTALRTIQTMMGPIMSTVLNPSAGPRPPQPQQVGNTGMRITPPQQ